MGKAIVEFEYIFHSSSATSSPPMHFAFAVVAASIGLAAAQTPAWIWNCGSGQGSIQSCNNACWAINCGSRFSRGSIYHPDRPNTNLHRIESGVKPNPNPCNDGWPRYKGWRRAGDRTGGGLPAKTADEFPLAALREGGARAKLRCVNGPDNSSGGSKLSAFFRRQNWGASGDATNNRRFTIIITNYGQAQYCGSRKSVVCTNDGAQFTYASGSGASRTFNSGKRDLDERQDGDEAPVNYFVEDTLEEDDDSLRAELDALLPQRKFLLSNGQEGMLLGRDNGTMDFDPAEVVGYTDDDDIVTIVKELNDW